MESELPPAQDLNAEPPPWAAPGASRVPAGWVWLRRGVFTPLLFGLSGVPALIYQVCWQRILAIHSGVGAFSVTVIVAAYMAGLGLGGQVGGRLSRRLSPLGSLRLFAATEMLIGLFAAFSGTLYYRLPTFAASWFQGTGTHVMVAHLSVLLPPTLLMGLTFPLLVRALVEDVAGSARLISLLYGLNLLGAALGAFLAPWVLIPEHGIEGTIQFGTCCNVLTALGVLFAGRPVERSNTGPTDSAIEINSRTDLSGTPRQQSTFLLWIVLYFLSGFIAIALEMIWFRVVDVASKSTAFTFGTVLAVYLAGLALGSLAGGPLAERFRRPLQVFLACQVGLLLYAGLALLAVMRLPESAWWIRWYFPYWGSYEPIAVDAHRPRDLLALYVEFPAFLFAFPTILMGLSFTALQRGVQDDVASSGYKVGVLQSANIAGCVLGAVAVGLRWFDHPGTAQTFRLLIASGIFFALLALLSAIRSKTDFRLELSGVAALALVAFFLPGQSAFWLRLHGRSDKGTLISEDVTGIAALVSEGDQRWRMSVNGKGQSYIPFGGVHSKLGALPATLLLAPERVAIIGLGTGDTAWAAGCRSETKLLRVFELSARQLPLLEELAGQHHPARLIDFLRNPALEVVTADGRTALAQSDNQYDLIEADAIRPNGAYSGNLYSIEFFRLCASRLRPGGLMCSWSPTERTRRTFLEAFPYVVEVDNGVVLLGSNSPILIDRDRWAARIRSEEVSRYLGSEVVTECLSALASARPLTRNATVPGDRNTDLFPRDEYLTPAR